MDFHAVSVNNVLQKSCKKQIGVSTQEVQTIDDEFLALSTSMQDQNNYLHGLTYKDQNSFAREVYFKLLGHQNRKLSSLNCKTYLCTLQKIFGKSYASKLVHLLTKYGVNASFYAHNEGIKWSEEDLDVMIHTFEDLPSFMFDAKKVFNIIRQDPRLTPPGLEKTIGTINLQNLEIRFYRKFHNITYLKKVAALNHELGHLFGIRLNLQYSKLWKSFSNWHMKKEKFRTKKRNFISKYSKYGPDEDFAETFSAFRYNSTSLKKKSPLKYLFMKEVIFGNLEFNDNNPDCDLNNKIFDTEAIKQFIDFSAVNQNCDFYALKYQLRRTTFDEVQKCVKSNFKSISINSDFDQIVSLENFKYEEVLKRNLQENNYPNLINLFQNGELNDLAFDSLILASPME